MTAKTENGLVFPTELETIEEGLRENVRLGFMEEITPGKFRLTKKGEDEVHNMAFPPKPADDDADRLALIEREIRAMSPENRRRLDELLCRLGEADRAKDVTPKLKRAEAGIKAAIRVSELDGDVRASLRATLAEIAAKDVTPKGDD